MNIYKKKSNVLGSLYAGIFSCAALQQSSIPELQIAESHYQCPSKRRCLLTHIVCFFSLALFSLTQKEVFIPSLRLFAYFFPNNYFNTSLSQKNPKKSHFPWNNTSSPIFSTSPDHLSGLSSWSLISFSVRTLFVSYYLFLTYKILEYTGSYHTLLLNCLLLHKQ